MSLAYDRVLLKSPMNPHTGYGIDGMLIADGLMKIGSDVHIEPKWVGVPVMDSILPLFVKPRPEQKHFDVALNHEYPGELEFPPSVPHFVDKVVGWTMFEFLSFGPSHEMAARLEDRLSVYDLILAYDEVSRQALAEYMPNDLDRLKVLQGGYDSEFWRPGENDAEREWDGVFRFGMNGTMNLRKNPWAVFGAFRSLKEEYGDDFNAELHMKMTSWAIPPELEKSVPGLKIHVGHWLPEKLKAFYLQMNCLLAPSWGEGKNLPALEAQTTGCPVIASAFGGHMQWADNSWAYLVDGPIEEHSPGMGSMRISEDTLAEKMWYVYNNRGEAKMKGEKASQIIPQMCDWQPVLERLDRIISETPAKNRG